MYLEILESFMTKRIINYLKNKHGCVYIIIALLCVITYILLSFLANEFSYKWAFMGNVDTWFGEITIGKLYMLRI